MKRKWSSVESTEKKIRLDLYPNIRSESIPDYDECEIRANQSKFYIELEDPIMDSIWSKQIQQNTFVSNRNKVQEWKTLHQLRKTNIETNEKLEEARKANEDKNILIQNQLLTQKYQPTKFVDLLTDHNLNREALRWLKSWDDAVFNGKLESIPKIKILLLAGPPGAGKTVLAHCIANHCGYEIMEINASDDRSQTTLIEEVKSRVQSNSILNQNKPKLVLLDEIDGVYGGTQSSGSSAIGALINMAKNVKKPLLRPIICTCNDLYSSSLKALRGYAKIISFKRGDGNIERVVSRLKKICFEENINLPINILQQIAQTHEGDIRSCLNAIQIVKLGSFSSNNNAQLKDVEKGYFDLMQYIFEGDQKTMSQFRQYFLQDQNNFNIIEGCFTNYPQQSFSDPYLKKIYKTIDALSFGDLINTTLLKFMQFNLSQYLTVSLYTTHYFCHSNHHIKGRYELPLQIYQAKRQFKENTQLAQDFHDNLSPQISSFYSQGDIALDLLDPLYDILNTIKIRKDISDVYLLDSKEKEILVDLHSIFKSFGLSYEFNHTSNRYILKPNIFHLLGDLRKNISEEGIVYGVPLCQFMNQANNEMKKHEAPHQMKASKSHFNTNDSPFKILSAKEKKEELHSAPIKFVFEDSASKAIRHKSRMEEWL